MLDSGSVLVGFMVDKVKIGQVFYKVLKFSAINYYSTDAQ
jgi:hypothetical protein